MSLAKAILGFIVGLIVCSLLLFFISVRSPMTTEETAPAAAVTEPETPTQTGDDGQSGDTAPATPADDQNDTGSQVEPDPPTDVQIGEALAPKPEMVEKPANAAPETVEDVTETQTAVIEPEVTEPEVTEPETAEVVEAAPEATKTETEDTAVIKEDDAETETALAKPVVRIGTDIGKKSVSELPTVGGESSGNRISFETVPNKPETRDENLGAFDKFTQAFAETTNPLVSIVLVDVGNDGLTRSELLKADFPVTYAIPANVKGASRASTDYFDAGYEVLLLNPAKAGSGLTETPSEIEAKLQAYLAAVPQAVGLIDNPRAELQKNRESQKAVLDHFQKTGHAVLSYKVGLDPTAREAAKREVPTASIFRVLDDNSEDSQTITRYLNRAVIEANQEGSAIVVGASTPDTMAAIQGWIQSGKAADVTLAPVTAAIRAKRALP